MKESNTGTLYTGKFIEKYNAEQLEIRESLPTLYELLSQAQEGHMELIDLLFFYKMKFITHDYLDGDKTSKVKSVAYELRIMDKSLNYFLIHLKKKYSDTRGIGRMDSIGGIKFQSSVKASKFDEDEIEILLNTYIKEFVGKHDLSKFTGKTLAHSNNRLIKYIKLDFENNVLKVEYNQRMGIERVQVDKKNYYVKNRTEEVFFDDTVYSKDEEESKTLLDVYSNMSQQDTDYSLTDESEYIFEKYKDIFTANQLEKFNAILEWCNSEGHSVEELFQKNNPSEISKTAISKILFPDRKTTSTMKDIENLFKSMKSRMDKALGKEGIESVKSTVSSTSNLLPDTFSAEEQKLFKEYNLDKYIIDVSQSKLPVHSMYKNVKIHNREPFIAPYYYEQLLQGNMSVQYIIDEYKISKQALNAKNGKVITYKMVDESEEYDLVIKQDEMDKLMKSHAGGIIERIQNGSISFTYDSETNSMVANTNQLNPIPVGLADSLYVIAPIRNTNIIYSHYNTNVLHTQRKFMKIVSKKEVENNESVKFISPSELALIRKENE